MPSASRSGHLHYLVTEGGTDRSGVFHLVPRIDDARLEELFVREVLDFLVRRELLSPEWAERLLSWRHSGFSVHSRVRAKTKAEAERVGKYMIRPLLALERLLFLEREGKVGYRNGSELERMDYLAFIARVVSPTKAKSWSASTACTLTLTGAKSARRAWRLCRCGLSRRS